MGRAHRPTKPIRKPRAQPTPYPLGTRLAESYGMDLDREKREGRPANGLGRLSTSRQSSSSNMPRARGGIRSWFLIAALIMLGVVSLFAFRHWHHREPTVVARCMEYPNIEKVLLGENGKAPWLPSFTPADARDIFLEKTMADGKWWIGFTAPAGFLKTLERRFDEITVVNWEFILVPPRHSSCWPDALNQGHESEKRKWHVFRTGRRYRSGTEYVAIGPGGKVVVWSGRP